MRNRWKKNPIVAEWIKKGYIDDAEIDFIVMDWNRYNAPTPPPHKIKQLTIAEYGKKHGCKVLVETGTFRGDMMDKLNEVQKKIVLNEYNQCTCT